MGETDQLSDVKKKDKERFCQQKGIVVKKLKLDDRDCRTLKRIV